MIKLLLLHGLRWWSALPDHPFKLRLITRSTEMLNSSIPAPVMGANFRIRPHEDIGRQIFFEGGYEAESIDIARSILADGGVFVDVGANFGLYSCVLAKIIGVQVVAIEPDALNFVRLRENVSLNGLTNVVAVNAAAWKVATLVELEQTIADNPGALAVKTSCGKLALGPSTLTAALPLLEILEIAGVNAIRLLKIDIEGLEMDVLESFFNDGDLRPAFIISELNQWGENKVSSRGEDLVRFLARIGYSEVRRIECNVVFEFSNPKV